ncbi:MAG: hypothetical protein U0794_17025 [Isosphaeraceae bacterium]
MPDVAGRGAALRGEAAGGGRGGQGPVERGPAPATVTAFAEAALLRLGQAAGGLREDEEAARVEAIQGGSPGLAAALDLADEFANLIRKRSKGALAAWRTSAEVSPYPELRRSAEGIRRDEAAVDEPWRAR